MTRRARTWAGRVGTDDRFVLVRHSARVLVAAALVASCMDPPPDEGQPPPIPTDAVVPTQGVGALPGAASVDVDGNATFTLPLAVPPGRSGMQPSLTLGYSSGRGNGLLGAGFGIAGLTSSITRCVHPHEAGGARRVTLTASDRLCLDGEPLLLDARSGVEYGMPGAEYRTERETVQRIVAGTGAGPGGPGQFTVYADDATVHVYRALEVDRVEHTALDGRAPVIGPAPLFRWDLVRIEDRHGNAILLEYDTTRSAPGEEPYFRQRLARIVYTRGSGQPARRRVELRYEPRPDASDVWFAGIRERIDYRLAGLEMHAPDASGTTHLAWSYSFAYLDGGSITGRSLLRSVTLCDAYGGCLPATRFEWSRGAQRYVRIPDALDEGSGVSGHLSVQLADVDGDGRDDLVSRSVMIDGAVYLRVHRSDGSGRFRTVDAVLENELARPPLIADLTGDGVAEIIGAELSEPLNRPCVSDASCATSAEHCVRPTPEALGVCSPSCECYRGSVAPPDGGACGEGSTPAGTNCAPQYLGCADLDGEGPPECIPPASSAPSCRDDAECPDLEHCVRPQAGAPGFCAPSCLCVFDPVAPPPGTWCDDEGLATSGSSSCYPEGVACGHLDGDGISECVARGLFEGRGWRIHHFAGGMITPGQLIEGNAHLAGHGAISFGDFDGDGAPDLLRRDDDALWAFGRNTWDPSEIFAGLMDPSAAAEMIDIDPRLGGPADEHRYGAVTQIVDLDGDGRTDVLIPMEGTPNPYTQVTLGEADTPSLLPTNLPAVYRDLLLIDVNGDGLLDAVNLGNRVRAPVAGARLNVRFNTGNGFGPAQPAIANADYHPFWPSEAWEPGVPVEVGTVFPEAWHSVDLRVRVLDYDQDGRDDFLMLGPEPRIYVSNGTGFDAIRLPFRHDDARVEVTFPFTDHRVTRRPPFLVGDLNADGQADFVHGEDLTVHLSARERPDLLLRITDGLGAIQRVTYAPLADAAVYDPSMDGHAGGCGFPTACASRRRSVVRFLHTTNPGHPDRRVTQRYAGARRDAETGELLGFTRIVTEDRDARARSEVWFAPEHRYVPPGATMRGAYRPLARRALRAYSERRVGQRAAVDRHDYRFVARSASDPPGEAHPLISRGRVARGYRFRVADTLARSYDEDWARWEAGGERTSERYVAMRDRFVDAWRSDRRAFQYGEVECVDPSDPDTPRPCTSRPRLNGLDPYPSAVATLTYDDDVAGADEVDWGPAPSGLRDFDRDVIALERTLYERESVEARWLIGQARTVETERCKGPEPTDFGQLRCALTDDEVVRRRTGIDYREDRPRIVTREPQRQFERDADGQPTSLYRRTTLEYSRGIVTGVLEETASGHARERDIVLDPLEQMFPSLVRQHVAGYFLEESFAWQPDLGVLALHLAPNGAETRLRYDGIGRLRGARAPGASWIETDYRASSRGGAMELARHGPSVVDTVVTLDALGRTTSVDAAGYASGPLGHVAVTYDRLGRLASATLPHAAGLAPVAAPAFEHTWDELGRPRRVDFRAAGAASPATVAHYEHAIVRPPTGVGAASVETTSIDALGNRHTAALDLRGWPSRGSAPDPAGGGALATAFDYDLWGTPVATRVEAGSLPGGAQATQAIAEVDPIGRPTLLVEAHRGALELRYDGFDQLVWQRDAAGNETTFAYDALGRLRERRDGTDVTSWQYDGGTHGLGRLDFTIAPDGTTVDYEYDEHGRLTREQHAIGAVDLRYDADGRIARVAYPDHGGKRFTIEHRYEDGYLAEILDVTDPDLGPRRLWLAEARHPDGRVSRERTGGDATTERAYDDRSGRLAALRVTSATGQLLADSRYLHRDNGELEERRDPVLGRRETFEQDSLGRLRHWTVETPAGAPRELEYAYDALGNLTRVEDLGTGEVDELRYERVRNAGPNGVTSLDSPAGAEELAYDALGRQTYGLGGRLVEYDHRDLPTRVQIGGDEIEYRYDAGGLRVEATHVRGGSLDRRVRYLGRLYERREDAGGLTQHVHYVHGPEGVVAQVIQEGGGGARPIYFHADELGSVALTTDEDGALGERQWFSPFGRRLADDGTFADSVPPGEVTRGFTGHEHDDDAGLIHMQARVYDPRLRRFLTPDPIVTGAGDSQAWNRYSYVGNATPNLVDPTGLQAAYPNLDPVDYLELDYLEFEDHVVIGQRGPPAHDSFEARHLSREPAATTQTGGGRDGRGTTSLTERYLGGLSQGTRRWAMASSTRAFALRTSCTGSPAQGRTACASSRPATTDVPPSSSRPCLPRCTSHARSSTGSAASARSSSAADEPSRAGTPATSPSCSASSHRRSSRSSSARGPRYEACSVGGGSPSPTWPQRWMTRRRRSRAPWGAMSPRSQALRRERTLSIGP